nr:hypothetical protein Ade03nite_68420 [Actinoplanes derwentensis]
MLSVAVLSALSWFGWMGWDNEYQADGSGPYEAWQVAGCGASLIVILALAIRLGARPLAAAAAMTVAFTSAWSVTAASTDTSGLWVVGMILVLVGMAAGTAMISLGSRLLLRSSGS